MARIGSISLLVAAALVAAALLAGGASGGGAPPVTAESAPPPNPPSITAIGTGTVRVAPAAHTERAIARVVAAAHARAVPVAFAVARAEALRQARAAGVELGAVQQVAPTPTAAYGFWSGIPSQGTFDAGRWCGVVRLRRHGGYVRRHACRRPHRESVTLSVTFDLRRP